MLQPLRNIGQPARDLARHERLAALGRFMVEQNAVAGIHAIGLTVIDRNPISEKLGRA